MLEKAVPAPSASMLVTSEPFANSLPPVLVDTKECNAACAKLFRTNTQRADGPYTYDALLLQGYRFQPSKLSKDTCLVLGSSHRAYVSGAEMLLMLATSRPRSTPSKLKSGENRETKPFHMHEIMLPVSCTWDWRSWLRHLGGVVPADSIMYMHVVA